MILSASQLKTFKRCPRLWWFEKVARFPRAGGAKYGLVFGKVLHSVLERWLEADASGRDPDTGKAVDLYPEGWDTDWETGETITPEDAELIPQLVQESVARGILRRSPTLKVEDAFVVPLLEEEGVYVQGRIDVLDTNPPTIEDHKGTVSMRWALSKEKLKDDDQMLLYAKILGDRLILQDKDEIKLRHNVYKRYSEGDSELTLRKTPAAATFLETKTRWSDFQARARQMLKVSVLRKHTDVKVSVGTQCDDYGGCSFLGVCTRNETPLKYKRRVLRLAQQKEEDPMSLEEKLAAKAAGKKKKGKPTPPKVGVNGPTTAAAPVEVAEPETNAKDLAPLPASRVVKVWPPRRAGSRLLDEGVAARGLTICQGCMPLKVGSQTPLHQSADLIQSVVAEDGMTMTEFYSKPAYDRASALARIAGKVAEQAKGATVVFPADLTHEGKALLEALTPYASTVYARVG